MLINREKIIKYRLRIGKYGLALIDQMDADGLNAAEMSLIICQGFGDLLVSAFKAVAEQVPGDQWNAVEFINAVKGDFLEQVARKDG